MMNLILFSIKKSVICSIFDIHSSNNMNYSTLVETKLVEIHQEKENKLNWDMDYFISRWGVNWDNKITVNLKGKHDGFNKWHNQNNRWPINLRIFKVQLPYVLIKKNGKQDSDVSDKKDVYADYLLIETLKNEGKDKFELLKKLMKVEYIADFNYAKNIKCSNNGSCCSDLNSVDSSCARKYDYFDGNGYGYSLYNSFGLKTINETSREVQFEIQLPIVGNEKAHELNEIDITNRPNQGNIFGGKLYFTGGYIIAWNKDDNKFLKDAKCENCCSKTIKNSKECKCLDGWKTQMEDAMGDTLLNQLIFNNSTDGTGRTIFHYFMKYNDGNWENDPINHRW